MTRYVTPQSQELSATTVPPEPDTQPNPDPAVPQPEPTGPIDPNDPQGPPLLRAGVPHLVATGGERA